MTPQLSTFWSFTRNLSPSITIVLSVIKLPSDSATKTPDDLLEWFSSPSIGEDLAKAETGRFIDALERNEGKLAENLAKLPQKYVQAHVEGNYVEIDEDGEGTPLNGDKAPAEKSVNKTL